MLLSLALMYATFAIWEECLFCPEIGLWTNSLYCYTMVNVYDVWDRYYSDTGVSLGTHNLGHLLWCLGADMEGRGHRCVHVWGGTMYRNGWTIVLECGLQDVVSNPPMYAPSLGLVSSVIIAAYVLTTLSMCRDELTPRWWRTVLYLCMLQCTYDFSITMPVLTSVNSGVFGIDLYWQV